MINTITIKHNVNTLSERELNDKLAKKEKKNCSKSICGNIDSSNFEKNKNKTTSKPKRNVENDYLNYTNCFSEMLYKN